MLKKKLSSVMILCMLTVLSIGMLGASQDIASANTLTKRVLANVAANKPTSASNTYANDSTNKYRANDNNITDAQGWSYGAVNPSKWWQVDLERLYRIKRIEIYDRPTTTEIENRRNLEVQVSASSSFSTYVTVGTITDANDNIFPAHGVWAISISDTTPYRFVRVVKTANEKVFITEVKVFAEETVTEVAKGKVADACSIYHSEADPDVHAAFKANDGINTGSTTTGWAPGDSSASPHLHWWRVDLGEARHIGLLEIEDRVNNTDDNLRKQFDIYGSNVKTTPIVDTDLTRVALLNGSNPAAYNPFPVGGTWRSELSDAPAYRYFTVRKSASQSFYLAEFRAFVINPEIMAIESKNSAVNVTFSDDMKASTLTPDNVKIMNAATNQEIEFSDINTTGNHFSVTLPQVENGTECKLVVNTNVMNNKDVAFAENYSENFVYSTSDNAIYKKYNVSNYKLMNTKDGTGSELVALKGGAPAGAMASVKNNDEENSKKISLMVGLYKDDTLVKVATDSKTIGTGALETFSTGFDSLPNEDLENYKIKSFLWENDTLEPLDRSLSLYGISKFDESLFSTIPQVYPLAGSDTQFAVDGLSAFFYEGQPYEGEPTRVFTYMGIPNVAPGTKVPAMVLVHGGGGKAESSWVKKWNDLGYAAIAIDMDGHTPDMQPHAYSGPSGNHYKDWAKDEKDMWIYHSVSNVIFAHNLLRNRPEIDTSKIGIMGISWGGVVTSTTIGVDSRFAFAIPVYGSGYLYEAESYFSDLMTPEHKDWDPSSFFTKSNMPILWINDDHDAHFPVSITSKSFLAVKNNSTLTILPDLAHSQAAGESPNEIYVFAENMINNTGTGLIKILDGGVEDGKAFVRYSLPAGLTAASAKLYYNTDAELPYSSTAFLGSWSSINPITNTEGRYEFNVPADCKRFYINVVDNYNRTVSTQLILTP